MQKFALDHIKSFTHSNEIEIKPITVFVGKNSCGKSSLLRFPIVLAQTFKEDALTPLLLFGKFIDYGNYDDVVYRHKEQSIGFKLAFGPEAADYIRRRYRFQRNYTNTYFKAANKTKTIEIQVYIHKPGKKLLVQEIRLTVNGEELCSLCQEKNAFIFKFHQLYASETWKTHEIKITLSNIKFNKFIPKLDEYELLKQYLSDNKILKEGIADISEHGFMQDLLEYIEMNVCEEEQIKAKAVLHTTYIINGYFSGIQVCLENEADSISYIGPFRESPKRTYRDSESSVKDVGVYGENVSMILRQAAQSDRKLLQNVSTWLQKTMGYSLDIKDVGNGLYSLIICGNEESDNIIDVGFGISQVLPIVTQLFHTDTYEQRLYSSYRKYKKTVVFEQPEIHLHPAAQAQLADLFVNCVSSKSDVKRILIETHSEHLIRKLQVLAADPDVPISNDQIAIYYVDKDHNGDSYVTKMELNKNGQFEKTWPNGFFDKSYELTKMLLHANSKNRQQENQND